MSRFVRPLFASFAGLGFAAAFAMFAAPVQAQSSSVAAVQKGRCPAGFTLQLASAASPPYAFCRRIVSEPSRDYTSYQPCIAPGTYVPGHESTGGALPAGHDRCTGPAGVVSGPALPCPPTHAQREIRSGMTDRCYRIETEQSPQFVNLTLFQ